MFCTKGTLKLPHGSEISIYYKTKAGIETKAPITATTTENLYSGTFKEDDVDFEFQIDNTLCKDRKIRVEIVSHKDDTGYSVNRGECRRLRTLQYYGQKFHIFGRSHKDGEKKISEASSFMATSFDEACKRISRFKFNVSYSKSLKTEFTILVEKGRDRFPLTVMKRNTLHELKSMIEAAVGFHPFTLCFGSVILQDDEKTLQELGLRRDDEIVVMTEFVSIHCRHIDEIIHLSLIQLTSTTIEQLKIMINVKKRYAIHRQQLLLSNHGAELKNHHTLGDYNIKNASLIQLILRCDGGGSGSGEVVCKCRRKEISNKRLRSEDGDGCNQTEESGVICMGDTSNQKFKEDRKYVEDKSVDVISFEIEMRVSRYSGFDLIV